MSIKGNLKELSEVFKKEPLFKGEETFEGVGVDTRKPLSQRIFFALKGPSFDGHDFLEEALKKEASILVVKKLPSEKKELLSKSTVFEVPDPLQALKDLATYWREKNDFKVVALTGSVGKTTTKNIIGKLLSSQIPTHISFESFNNEIGVPLTLLGASSSIKVVVVEMGMNHLGEIRHLCQIAKPNASLVLCVGASHAGNFKNLEEIAQAKEEIYENVDFKIFNLDDPFTKKMFEKNKKEPHLSFSEADEKADVFLQALEIKKDSFLLKGRLGDQTGEARVFLTGSHHLTNVMASCCVALHLGGKDLWKPLKGLRVDSWGRAQRFFFQDVEIFFDAYNASPPSMEAILEHLRSTTKGSRKFLILGEMLELGEKARTYHEDLAHKSLSLDPELIWFLGSSKGVFGSTLKSRGYKKSLFLSETYDEGLAKKIKNMLKAGDTVLIKGSRGMKLEKVLETWGLGN